MYIPTSFFLLLSILSVASAQQSPSKPVESVGYTDDKAFRQAVLENTNTYRVQHNVSELTWNETLARKASDYAGKCIFEHSTSGENLAAGYATVSAAIRGWGDERKDYEFDEGEFSESAGHFTQLVWRNTSSVGCGKKQCGDPKGKKGRAFGWYIVCQYYPAGNVIRAFKDNVEKKVNDRNLTTLVETAPGPGGVVVQTPGKPDEIYPGQPLNEAWHGGKRVRWGLLVMGVGLAVGSQVV